MGTAVRLIQGRVEVVANAGIGCEFLARCECLIIGVELRFQDSQPIEFREEKPGGIGRWSHRVIRVLLLPGQKDLMGLRKIEVI